MGLAGVWGATVGNRCEYDQSKLNAFGKYYETYVWLIHVNEDLKYTHV